MKQIPLDHFLNYKFLSNLKAIDKKKLSFVVGNANYEKNNYSYELFEFEDKSKKVFSFLDRPGFIYESENTFLFNFEKTKDEKKLKKEMNTIYYRYFLDTKKRELAYKFDFPVSIVEVLEDKLILKANLNDTELSLRGRDEESRKEVLKKLEIAKNFEVIDQLPYYFNGEGFVANKTSYLFVYDLKDNSYSTLNYQGVSVGGYKLDDKKENLYYIATTKAPKMKLTNQVYKYNLETKTLDVIYDGDEFSISSLFFVGGELVVYATNGDKIGMNQNRSFYKVKNNSLKLLTTFPTSLGNSVGSDCRLGGSPTSVNYKDKLLFTTTVDDHSELYLLDKSGKTEQVFMADGSIDAVEVVNDKVYVVMMYKQKLQELYELDLDSKKLKQLTRFNNKVLNGYYVAKPKTVVVKKKTHEVKGFVLLPKDFDKNKKYPAILNIHGGPKTVYGKVFVHEMQMWANLGYLVMFANPRGSDGKGDEFSDIRGKYGTIDYDDLMDFTDKVLKSYKQIDEKRVFVTGGSYGGFMTNWIVGQTNRFRAAATQRSISNWLTFYPTADIGFYFAGDQTGGDPVNNMEKLWDQSPLKFVDKVTTPLLFIHSDKDYRCPMEQAMQFYGLLKDRGHKTKLVWFKDETHELSRSGRPQGRVKRLNEITSWFEEHK